MKAKLYKAIELDIIVEYPFVCTYIIYDRCQGRGHPEQDELTLQMSDAVKAIITWRDKESEFIGFPPLHPVSDRG